MCEWEFEWGYILEENETIKVKPITEYKDLMRTLGKTGLKIAYETDCFGTKGEHKSRGRTGYVIYNPWTHILSLHRQIPRELDDILRGVSFLDWYRPSSKSLPLGVNKLYWILSSVGEITTTEVMNRIGVGKRQAQRYMKALRIVWAWIDKACILIASQYIRRNFSKGFLRIYKVNFAMGGVKRLSDPIASQYIVRILSAISLRIKVSGYTFDEFYLDEYLWEDSV